MYHWQPGPNWTSNWNSMHIFARYFYHVFWSYGIKSMRNYIHIEIKSMVLLTIKRSHYKTTIFASFCYTKLRKWRIKFHFAGLDTGQIDPLWGGFCLSEGGVRVCGDAVLLYFWFGFVEIFFNLMYCGFIRLSGFFKRSTDSVKLQPNSFLRHVSLKTSLFMNF